MKTQRAKLQNHSPARYFLLCYGVIPDARNIGLLTTGTAWQLLIAPVLAEAAAVAGTNVAEVAALADLCTGARRPVLLRAAGEARAQRRAIAVLLAGGGGRPGGRDVQGRGRVLFRPPLGRGLPQPLSWMHLRRRQGVFRHPLWARREVSPGERWRRSWGQTCSTRG